MRRRDWLVRFPRFADRNVISWGPKLDAILGSFTHSQIVKMGRVAVVASLNWLL